MSSIIEIPQEELFNYCIALPHPMMESVVIREVVDPRCRGMQFTIYQKHFSLFHTLYTIRSNALYRGYMVNVDPMYIVIRKYPSHSHCIHYDPKRDSFCNDVTVDGTYCMYHYNYYKPYMRGMVIDVLTEFYSDPCNIEFEHTEIFKTVYRKIGTFIVSKKKIDAALKFFGFATIADCNRVILRKRYWQFAKMHHPDVCDSDPSFMKEVNAHYSILKDFFNL